MTVLGDPALRRVHPRADTSQGIPKSFGMIHVTEMIQLVKHDVVCVFVG